VDGASEAARQNRRREVLRIALEQHHVRKSPARDAARHQPEVLARDLDAEEARGGLLGSAPQEVAPFAEADLDLPGFEPELRGTGRRRKWLRQSRVAEQRAQAQCIGDARPPAHAALPGRGQKS
jgi:hypothetical protein